MNAETVVELQDVHRLYRALESAHNQHGGCGCPTCKSVEFALMDIRTKYGFADGLARTYEHKQALREMNSGRRCSCGSLMIHTRLRGYQCPRGCQ